MKQERDKVIAEALGLCWHNIYDRMSALTNTDTGVTKVFCDVCEQWVEPPNPNFSTFDGMGLILQKGPKREWWYRFLQHLEDKGYATFISSPNGTNCIWYLSVWMVKDPDHLANKLYTFLKEGKRK